ncbi:maleate cis-trans isomerase family protein [Streptomyces clavuligerus]|nr:decarboxylase [Streptomyces clavuligerus]ANW20053.1 decarboxylase [Streptomyces clavuligerus]AXU14679.1 decarboxylase [Streptomyces clavuligerus]MBY6304699.1 decarboxylase [Streptomyces clavuligerus]QCS07449.1 decarboxylase [Streptomyces clavuligerus]QPJ93202.1 decarboxylase [Streptomyces clavuligerus]
MTTVGLLYPGHLAEEDFPRLEVLLDSDIRLPLVHTDRTEDSRHGDALREMSAPQRLAAGVDELRLAGAESVVWASAAGGFVHGPEGAHRQVRELALAAGLPASSTAFGFAHAARRLKAVRVAVAAAWPEEIQAYCAAFLAAEGVEVVATGGALAPVAEVVSWGREEVLGLAVSADHPTADAVLLPDTALHTAAHLDELEERLAKPVLTASQVTVWEGLRLADRRAWAFHLGTLFARPGL